MDIVWHTFYGLQYVEEEKLAARPNKNYNNFYSNNKRTRHWIELKWGKTAEGDTEWERWKEGKKSECKLWSEATSKYHGAYHEDFINHAVVSLFTKLIFHFN